MSFFFFLALTLFLSPLQVSFSISQSFSAYFFFYLKFSILLLFSHPFLTFFSLSSLWNWFLTCAAVVQGPPGLPGLKGDPGSKGEKVGVGTYYCVRLRGGFISPNVKWADKQTYKQWKELWALSLFRSDVQIAHQKHTCSTTLQQIKSRSSFWNTKNHQRHHKVM